MRKNIEYIYSDSRVLLSILYGGAKNGARLEDIIAAGDFINHAIFCFEEIEGAFARLSAGKFIRRKGRRFFPSEKTLRFWSAMGKENRRVHKDWESITQFIHARSLEIQSVPQRANEGVSYKGVNREQFQKAVNNYLAKTG